MNKLATSSHDSLHKLSSVFAARRARLAFDLSNDPPRAGRERPIAKLQDYGYSIAAGLVATALLPFIVRVLVKRRKMIFKALMAVLRLRKFGRKNALPRLPARAS